MCQITQHQPVNTMRLLVCGFDVLELAHNGKLFSGNAADIADSVSALDKLEEAMSTIVKSMPKTTSAFLRHRAEVLAEGFSGDQLRALVKAMADDSQSSINFNALLQQLDTKHTNIALELIDQFAGTGTRDMHFVELHAHITERAS